MKRAELKLENFLQQKASGIVWVCITVYILFLCIFSLLKYKSFSYTDTDLSALERTFWNIIHGIFFQGNTLEPTIFSGGHLSLIFFFFAPLYAIYPHPLTLLFMQSIFLALPAYFIFRLARDKIDATFATYFALAYLLYPALAYVNLFELHMIAFAPFFLILMFIFFDQQRFWPFVLFMFLSLACKEDVSLIIFGLGLYALFKYGRLKFPFIKREDWKWVAVPFLSGGLWFIMVTQFIQPHFTPYELKGLVDSRGMLSFYGWLGRTPGEIIKNIFFHPIQVTRNIFIPPKNTYLLHLFGPLGFLSVFGWQEMIIVFFGLLEGLLSQRGTHFCIYYQYPALFMTFIFISAIFGLKRLLQLNLFKRSRLYVVGVLLSISLFSSFNIGPLFRLPLKEWMPDERDALKERFVTLIPDDARVASSFELATRLTHRSRSFPIFHVNMGSLGPNYVYFTNKYGENADYLLTDFLDYLTYFGFYYPDSDIFLADFLRTYHWSLAYEINNLTLWTKAKDKPAQLIEVIDNFPEQLNGPSFSNGYIKLVGCQLKPQIILEIPVLHLDGYLECQNQTEQRYILQLDFYSNGDKKLLYRHYFVAPDRIYPTKRWKKGEKIKISQNVSLPSLVEPEDCHLQLNFCLVQ